MWNVEPLNETHEGIYTKCVSRMRSRIKKEVKDNLCDIRSNAIIYACLARSGLLHTAQKSWFSIGNATDIELESLYEKLRDNKTSRQLWEDLRDSFNDGICVYCVHNTATSLDHFAPISRFQPLSILLTNLVPSCAACNGALHDEWATTPDAEPIHPFYSNHLNLGRWLKASLDDWPGVSVSFTASPSKNLDPFLADRIRLQFDRLGLAETFAKLASNRLSELQSTWDFDADPDEVRKDFIKDRDTYRMDVNCWGYAFYDALAESRWFCAGGAFK